MTDVTCSASGPSRLEEREGGVPSENSVSIESIDVIRSKPIGCPLPC
jgi:hypothetical protein